MTSEVKPYFFRDDHSQPPTSKILEYEQSLRDKTGYCGMSAKSHRPSHRHPRTYKKSHRSSLHVTIEQTTQCSSSSYFFNFSSVSQVYPFLNITILIISSPRSRARLEFGLPMGPKLANLNDPPPRRRTPPPPSRQQMLGRLLSLRNNRNIPFLRRKYPLNGHSCLRQHNSFCP
jgi:hypothetical protein